MIFDIDILICKIILIKCYFINILTFNLIIQFFWIIQYYILDLEI